MFRKREVVDPGYRVQQVNDPDPAYFWPLLVTFVALAALYAIWRTVVVNWGVWFGPLAWIAEMFGLTTSVLFVLLLKRTARPIPRVVTIPSTTVDILIPTCNEPLSILEPTVIGAAKVRGVRDVLVLDDGVRDEVRAMAARHGVNYVSRARNEGAKAGNLNHGLRETDAEFVITLDADHIPLPEFVERTLGYFDDPDVGFVQSPQSFYNTESFTFRSRRGQRGAWHEQEMFYGGVQPAKNHTNSAIYTGTSAMLRRSALDSVNGFATDTPTEDIHTSLRLHAKSWRSVYLRTPLAYGLEVENLREYYRTRRRWAVGSIRLLFCHPDSPLRIRGLTLSQRTNYLSAMVAHLQGANRVLYLVTPIAALVTGLAPVEGSYARYGFAFLGLMVLSQWIIVQFGRGHYHLLHSEVFGIADTMPMLAGLGALFRAEQAFEVTEKQASRAAGNRLKVAYRLYAAVSCAALALAIIRLARGEYVAIAAWSAAFLALTVGYLVAFLVSMERYERRSDIPPYAGLNPGERYDYVLARSTGRRD
ncbi:MAG: glycosyltransferase [Micromonosporaceae bacterium]|nr:glycosyltransferase [Micromonosporaceae bacterium]